MEISRLPCGGFSLGQTQYIDDLKEIQINAERRRHDLVTMDDNGSSNSNIYGYPDNYIFIYTSNY